MQSATGEIVMLFKPQYGSVPSVRNLILLLLVSVGLSPTVEAQPTVSQEGSVTVLTIGSEQSTPPPFDYASAMPFKLPVASGYSAAVSQVDLVRAVTAPPEKRGRIQTQYKQLGGSDRGSPGTGEKSPLTLVAPGSRPRPAGPTTPEEFGTAQLPFSTARADLDPQATNDQWPFRAAGKLFFKIGAGNFICSASLIKKGLVVTAAHCAAEFGQNKYFSDWRFVPGYRNGSAPFGSWSVAKALVLDTYYKGTEPCYQKGVVCENDVAVLVLSPQRDANNALFYPGTKSGWYGYGWNRSGFTPGGITHMTQLGYPACLDDGEYMERNDTQGVTSSDFSNNTVSGSLMCGGASGGPILINFGVRPALSGTLSGTAAEPNMVVGVTSWGSTNDAVKQMGASPFLTTNIVELVRVACNSHPDACN
jgi:V8-like Glu-specific endopeptidase